MHTSVISGRRQRSTQEAGVWETQALPKIKTSNKKQTKKTPQIHETPLVKISDG